MSEESTPFAKPAGLQKYRRFSQFTFLVLLGQWSFYGLFRCPFPVPFVSCATCPVITCWGRITALFWGFWLILPVSVILFGRAFCGWACPGGLVNDLLVKVSPFSKRFKRHLNPIAPLGMVLAAGFALFLWLWLDNPRWAVPIREGEFFGSVSLTFAHADWRWLTRTLTVLGLVLLGMAGTGIWCRWACPTGGVLEVFKRFSVFSIFKTEKCDDCDRCRRVCDRKTRPGENNCTNCSACLGHCPQNAIRIGRSGRKSA